ncbi:PAS domain-containing protein [Methylobacterium sp. NEAU K]|uniref:PAS domain-containing protein n=1 Tax=Methylobacterium sp. NEAU K TaxID=3064946 RepID=UPI0027349DF7|nr:PAS domain-containing protein [Methylobacterium sp. NEAU K]MDP4004109.1 PAS domain-containing protein [Methylobacterium sp. NEAU K]
MSDPIETARLQVLHSYGILDTPREPAFDDIVTLATQVCAVPVGLVSLIAADRQWFKARIGFPDVETPLSQSVCAHAMTAEGGLLVIPDLSLDPRTRENPLVSGAPFIRFYAGAVLRTEDGVPFGTLCVIDTAPRPDGLYPEQAFTLRALARQVMAQLELRRAIREREKALAAERLVRDALATSEERYRLSARATTDLIWDWDRDTGRIHWDDELCTLYGYRPDEIEASTVWWYEHIHPEDRERVRRSVLAAVESAQMRWSAEYRFRRADGTYATILNRAIIVRTPDGSANRVTGVMLDATQRAEADAHREMLSQELSHRLKNTLAMVQAIASQTLRGAADIESARDALIQRLLALGKAHDILLAGNAEQAGMEAVIRGALALHDNARAGRLRIEGPALDIGPKAALALALMVHELATNAAKYGALTAEMGNVTVTWRIEAAEDEPQVRLTWSESGGPPVLRPTRKGFGTRLIERVLAGTVAGEVALDYRQTGLHCELTAPLTGFQGKDGVST